MDEALELLGGEGCKWYDVLLGDGMRFHCFGQLAKRTAHVVVVALAACGTPALAGDELAPMIESEAALNSADAIAAVPGVDVVHIGTSDLSSDIGAPGSNMHPKVLEAVETVVAACRRHNKIPGVGGLGGGDPRNYEEVIRLGARFFSAGNDWALMMSAFQERVNMLRAIKIP